MYCRDVHVRESWQEFVENIEVQVAICDYSSDNNKVNVEKRTNSYGWLDFEFLHWHYDQCENDTGSIEQLKPFL